MLIAQRISQTEFKIGNYWDLFPESSFPTDGPNTAWYTENTCYKVNLNIPYDLETQELQAADPYLENGWVYMHRAVDKI